MNIAPRRLHWSAERGTTLIELIVFIVVVSVALAGVLTVFNITVRHSADPMVVKQALAVAEMTMEEVLLKDFCDPSAAVSPPAGGTLAAGNATVTDVDTTGVVVGWFASGGGIPPQTTVSAIGPAPNSLTLSNAATIAGARVALRFAACVPTGEPGGRAAFDDVMDYDGFASLGASTLSGPVAGLGNYNVAATVTPPAAPIGGVVTADIRQVTVTVTVGGDTYQLTGYRFNYD